jgi:hypothetical protein
MPNVSIRIRVETIFSPANRSITMPHTRIGEFTDTSLVPVGHVPLSQVEWAAVYPGHRRACLANRTIVKTPTGREALKISSVRDSNG